MKNGEYSGKAEFSSYWYEIHLFQLLLFQKYIYNYLTTTTTTTTTIVDNLYLAYV